MPFIKAPNLANGHYRIVKTIYEKGGPVITENGEWTLELNETSVIHLKNPLEEPMVHERSRFQRKFLDKYAENVIFGSDSKFEYDYNGRLRKYDGHLGSSCANVESIDQVDYIIKKLRKNPQSRRAIAITWIPRIDENNDDCPCLQLLQCLVRSDDHGEMKLNEKVVFRSNDMLSAAASNAYAFIKLQKHIAEELNLPLGSYEHISTNPHIYYKRDFDDLKKMITHETAEKDFIERDEKLRPIFERMEYEMDRKGLIRKK